MNTNSPSFDDFRKMSEKERLEYFTDNEKPDTSFPESFVLEALRVEPSSLVRWHLIKKLGSVGSARAIPVLIQQCENQEVDFGNSSLHSITAWSLGKIGSEAFEATTVLLNKSELELRRCAIDALGEIKDPRGIPILLSSLENDEYEIKLYAGLSLAKIGEPALPGLHSLIQKVDQRTRFIALDAIVKIGSQDSIPLFKNLLRNGSAEDKASVLRLAKAFHRKLAADIQEIADSDVSGTAVLARQTLAALPADD